MSNVVAFRKPGTAPLEPLPPITTLSFVHDYWVRRPGRKRGQPFRCFWAVTASGDNRADVDRGHEYALEWQRHCGKRNLGPVLLSWIIEDMPPRLGALERGFISMIGLWAGNNPHAEEITQYRRMKDERFRRLMNT